MKEIIFTKLSCGSYIKDIDLCSLCSNPSDCFNCENRFDCERIEELKDDGYEVTIRNDYGFIEEADINGS